MPWPRRCLRRRLFRLLIALAAPSLAQPPTDAQRSAIRSACRGDYANVCANVPTGGKEALQCLQQHQSEVSTKCQDALAALDPPPPAPTTSAAATASPPSSPSPATAPAQKPQMSPRQQMQLLRTDCSADFQKFCSNVELGGGRGLACLREHQTQLSSLCQSALLLAGTAKQ